jgi:heavy metal translocating P-type ATPase
MADRYAAILLPVTLGIAGAAWALSGDPVRALAVLVVATPCPLILAAPVALISGVSRAARHGVIAKGGGTIEKLGRARTVLFDKTGTLTHGRPEIEEVKSADGLPPTELLRLAASVDQLSAHVLAEALVHGAEGRGIELEFPEDVVEDPGQGIEGLVAGHRVAVGSSEWLRRRGYSGTEGAGGLLDGSAEPGWARVLIGVDGELAGAVLLADHLRDDAAELTTELRTAGVDQVVLVTGDQRAVGEAVGKAVGVDRVFAECSPDQKIEVVRKARQLAHDGAVVMVGDGVNDAPALALADVGIAMGGVGATVSSEAADAVIAVDRIDRVADALRIGRRSLGIARQSVLAGLGLSFAAMGFAAFGYIPPIAGALLQEGIDIAVILNALRALRG